jgi:ribosomal protein S18 acetylase RimI-like enzyme
MERDDFLKIRNISSSDYQSVISVVNDWWDGRDMAKLLPKLFFDHFSSTSYILEEHGQIAGFLIGFISQSRDKEAYIHFVGIHPKYRKQGLGRLLYEQFFDEVKKRGVKMVRCVTSPVNKTSIAYHKKMEFSIEEGGLCVDGISIHSDYDGQGGDRVLFVKSLV